MQDQTLLIDPFCSWQSCWVWLYVCQGLAWRYHTNWEGTSKGKCCVTGGGADTLNMLEQHSSASWDLSPVLTLLVQFHSPAGYTCVFHNRPALSSWIHILLDFRISLLRFSFLLSCRNSSFVCILMHFLNINSWSNSYLLLFYYLQLKIRA